MWWQKGVHILVTLYGAGYILSFYRVGPENLHCDLGADGQSIGCGIVLYGSGHLLEQIPGHMVTSGECSTGIGWT